MSYSLTSHLRISSGRSYLTLIYKRQVYPYLYIIGYKHLYHYIKGTSPLYHSHLKWPLTWEYQVAGGHTSLTFLVKPFCERPLVRECKVAVGRVYCMSKWMVLDSHSAKYKEEHDTILLSITVYIFIYLAIIYFIMEVIISCPQFFSPNVFIPAYIKC